MNLIVFTAFAILGIGFLVGSVHIARDKGYSGEFGFWICFLFYAIGGLLFYFVLVELFVVALIGLVIVTLLPDQTKKRTRRRVSS